MAKKPTTLHAIINELVDRTNSNTQRLRVLEQRSEVLSSRANTIEQEILNLNRHIQRVMLSIDTKTKKIEDRVRKSEGILKEVVKQMKKLATTSKISELEQLIEIYNPIKSQFMTREEVERIIEEKKNK
ncbi:MAG: hypothetical protein JSW41_03735 [Candidatus Aenigmatarchaeota archaeon]|nr:MAG: hypothetical protein JSW41_03735 [Candidatus Aenigmarchaeota archaeon]